MWAIGWIVYCRAVNESTNGRFIVATTDNKKTRRSGFFYACRLALTAKQIATLWFKRLSNQHQHGDNQEDREGPQQPLHHIQREKFPLTDGAVTSSDEHLWQPFI